MSAAKDTLRAPIDIAPFPPYSHCCSSSLQGCSGPEWTGPFSRAAGPSE